MNRRKKKIVPIRENSSPENQERRDHPFGNLRLPVTTGERYVYLRESADELRNLILKKVPAHVLEEYEETIRELREIERRHPDCMEDYRMVKEYESMIGEIIRESGDGIRLTDADEDDDAEDSEP